MRQGCACAHERFVSRVALTHRTKEADSVQRWVLLKRTFFFFWALSYGREKGAFPAAHFQGAGGAAVKKILRPVRIELTTLGL